ncbi:MAG: 50S ribosomal protein L13 [Candidatus Doudnabacteria bacterium CG10_big_fil_rev_8_21_14_0_10_41_10]|uniref:Large ribosomal subunit protein uL13 n=1 Tax=Candidatus Doudnabacteria bacterium CG10_big_fil_rev_8_21_14_0_10_41_10 TaxID=1974551 RepID=A0A2H0VD19_9BACT|nr:MAG: 50S ribosomal protein L13 [Candidatus Doudnabacteria bacterium CG10_big_fil_rev_8_21_14_0_10_41_10]
MKTTIKQPKDVKRNWHEFDASKFTLGRLSTKIAKILMGKDKLDYTPHVDMGDYVVVVNAEEVKFTGRKIDQKKYTRYSGYPGGITTTSLKTMLVKKPTFVIQEAVRGMLAKTKLQKAQMRRLKVVIGSKHDFKINNIKAEI